MSEAPVTDISEDQSDAGLVQIGEFGIAHGVSGRIKIRTFTEDPATVATLGPVVDEDGTEYRLKKTGDWKDGIVVTVEGIKDRDQAEALKGRGVFVARAMLPDAEQDEVYHVDLIGLEAWIADREETATIIGFHNFGASDLMEVQPSWTKDTVMVPFDQDFIIELDVAAKRVIIDNIPGLFPDTEEEKKAAANEKKKERRRKKAIAAAAETKADEAALDDLKLEDDGDI